MVLTSSISVNPVYDIQRVPENLYCEDVSLEEPAKKEAQSGQLSKIVGHLGINIFLVEEKN